MVVCEEECFHAEVWLKLGHIGNVFVVVKAQVKFLESETRRERLKSALYLRLKKRRFEICVGRFHKKLVFGPPPPPYNNAIYFGYNVKRSDIALNSGYYEGTSIKSKGGHLEGKKQFRKKNLTASKKREVSFSLIRFCMLRLKSKN